MKKAPLRQLSPRLSQLSNWVEHSEPYDAIWDLCCDHGLLGLHLYQNQTQSHIYLVDRVTSIIERLNHRIDAKSHERLTALHSNAENIQLSWGSQKEPRQKPRQLIILAGLGGESIIHILRGIVASNAETMRNANIEFLLSANSHSYELRQYLRESNCRLINEVFVVDNGWSHEHMHIAWQHNQCKQPTVPVSELGIKIWHPWDAARQAYLSGILTHLENQTRYSPDTYSAEKLKAYKTLEITLNSTPHARTHEYSASASELFSPRVQA